jgi:hypothetical protein
MYFCTLSTKGNKILIFYFIERNCVTCIPTSHLRRLWFRSHCRHQRLGKRSAPQAGSPTLQKQSRYPLSRKMGGTHRRSAQCDEEKKALSSPGIEKLLRCSARNLANKPAMTSEHTVIQRFVIWGIESVVKKAPKSKGNTDTLWSKLGKSKKLK